MCRAFKADGFKGKDLVRFTSYMVMTLRVLHRIFPVECSWLPVRSAKYVAHYWVVPMNIFEKKFGSAVRNLIRSINS